MLVAIVIAFLWTAILRPLRKTSLPFTLRAFLLFLLGLGSLLVPNLHSILRFDSICDRDLVLQRNGLIVAKPSEEQLNHEHASDPLLV